MKKAISIIQRFFIHLFGGVTKEEANAVQPDRVRLCRSEITFNYPEVELFRKGGGLAERIQDKCLFEFVDVVKDYIRYSVYDDPIQGKKHIIGRIAVYRIDGGMDFGGLQSIAGLIRHDGRQSVKDPAILHTVKFEWPKEGGNG